jgi:hypothetical protein
MWVSLSLSLATGQFFRSPSRQPPIASHILRRVRCTSPFLEPPPGKFLHLAVSSRGTLGRPRLRPCPRVGVSLHLSATTTAIPLEHSGGFETARAVD